MGGSEDRKPLEVSSDMKSRTSKCVELTDPDFRSFGPSETDGGCGVAVAVGCFRFQGF